MNRNRHLKQWLDERGIGSAELIVPDMAGVARGKIHPAAQIGSSDAKLPVAIFAQTINSDFHMPMENVADRDMTLQPDIESLRPVPWATEPTASAIMDCFDGDGQPIEVSPRAVLQRVVEKFSAKDWMPIVAPELEFYLTKAPMGENGEAVLNRLPDPYGMDGVHDLGRFFEQLFDYCCLQSIPVGAVSQELGPSQFEVNFEHGPAVKLADDVFHFKRTIKRVAMAHGLRVTFLAKPSTDGAGSSMHVHQSVYDSSNSNIFSDTDTKPSKLFEYYLGGLQRHMPEALLLFAPYANSYRRFLSYYSSPVNLEWGVDNRTAGLRVPNSDGNARRIENRLAGSDVNPYLVIAATLACGYLGMTRELSARNAVAGSAYELPFALHRHLYEALDAFRGSGVLREVLGDDFVTQYCAVKELEYREFQRHISSWEQRELMFSV